MGYICFRYFLKLHYFLVHKLGLIKLSTFPQFSQISYRSITRFSRYNKIERPKKHLLFNLYFFTRIRWIKLFMDMYGLDCVFNKPIRGWSVTINKTQDSDLNLISGYNLLLYKVLAENTKISFYKIRHNWGSLHPFYWNSLKLQLPVFWTRESFKARYFIRKYWNFVGDKRKHLLQYRLDVSNMPKINHIFKSVLKNKTSVFFKVMFLRMHKYPVLFKYMQIDTIVTLSQYGWKRGRLPLNKLYQKGRLEADPSAMRLQEVLQSLFDVYLEGDIHTELHMIRALRATITTKLNLGIMVRADLIFAQPVAVANKVLKRWNAR